MVEPAETRVRTLGPGGARDHQLCHQLGVSWLSGKAAMRFSGIEPIIVSTDGSENNPGPSPPPPEYRRAATTLEFHGALRRWNA